MTTEIEPSDELSQARIRKLVGEYHERTDCPHCSTIITKKTLAELWRKAEAAERLAEAAESALSYLEDDRDGGLRAALQAYSEIKETP